MAVFGSLDLYLSWIHFFYLDIVTDNVPKMWIDKKKEVSSDKVLYLNPSL